MVTIDRLVEISGIEMSGATSTPMTAEEMAALIHHEMTQGESQSVDEAITKLWDDIETRDTAYKAWMTK